MHFLLLNQTFHPDVASTAQHLSDLALGLAAHGHQVTVVTSRRAYDHPEKLFPKQETWKGIRICRIGSTGFGKGARWRRAADFGSFIALGALRLAVLPRPDAVVALTSPPLISFLGALLAKLRRCRFYYWVMDFNPDEAIAAGWLRPGSLVARTLDWMSLFSLKQAARIIALDRFMRERIVAKGVNADKIAVIPPWSHDTEVKFDGDGRQRFRKAHGLDGKFVVMYSGNHSPCHPLDTVLQAASRFAGDSQIAFCFVGGGSEWRKIQQLSTAPSPTHPLTHSPTLPLSAPGGEGQREVALNSTPRSPSPGGEGRGEGEPLSAPSTTNAQPSIPPSPPTHPLTRSPTHSPQLLCLPYQPLNHLAASLSAADLHLVVMGDPFVGLVHPCKIYNILSVACPVLYIGPQPSHLSEIFDALNGQYPCASARHGEVEKVLLHIQEIRRQVSPLDRRVAPALCGRFSKETLLPKLIAGLESKTAANAER